MNSTMAFAISTPTSSTGLKTSYVCALSISAVPIPRNAIFQQIKCLPQLGFTPFSQWNGLRQMGISISQYSVKMERKGKCKGKGVYASLFGVGAPEALVIGVVALLVFGPKGLAEVARNLGKTLRAFQPTIKELQEVSREFKSTLEREIGLDDIDNPAPKRPMPTPTPEDKLEDLETNIEPNGSTAESDSKDDYVKVQANQFTAALAQLRKEQEEEKEEKEKVEREKTEIQSESQTPSQDSDTTPQAIDTAQESSSVTPSSQNPENSVLQEAAPVGSMSPGENPETET